MARLFPSHPMPLSLSALLALLLTGLAVTSYAAENEAFPVMDDRTFFAAIDTDRAGLEGVREAVNDEDFEAARRELWSYYRERDAKVWWFNPKTGPDEPRTRSRSYEGLSNLRDRKGAFVSERFFETGEFNWYHPDLPGKWYRMYFWQALGRGYWESGEEEWGAREWVRMMRSFVRQGARKERDPYWATMTVGIQLRTGWPNAFAYFLHSDAFTPENMVLFLKATLERARYLRENHSETSNWLTFEMAGLYCTGVLYPEFRQAAEWRTHAGEVAVTDMQRGYLPDGATVELSPGYHQFFSNYLTMARLAEATDRLEEDGLDRLVAACEKPFAFYVQLMGPDRVLPAFNDNGPVNAPDKLGLAVELFPERTDFAWVASDGKEGEPPAFTSTFLPYAGLGAMRSGWERDANCLAFDMGPVGYRHAHQDKLNLVLWAYGRQILFDPGCGDYSDNPYTRYCRDTFSHNTVLVDNRPQRRRWYQNPHPKSMPYQPCEDVQWRTSAERDWAAGRYDENYGKPGASDSYPYKEGSDFLEGWGRPAVHHRQVLFLKPDVFLVWDHLESVDGEEHTYEARWHLDTTVTQRQDNAVRSADDGVPNLAVIPLLSDGVEVRVTSAQEEPELLGWHVLREPRPATTVQHIKRGVTADMLTLLLPLKPAREGDPRVESVSVDAERGIRARLSDGREVSVQLPDAPEGRLEGEVLAEPAGR